MGSLTVSSAYNFCFHPFSASHGPLKSFVSVVAIVALTALTLGAYGILFAGVHLAEWLKGKSLVQLESSSASTVQLPFKEVQPDDLRTLIKNKAVTDSDLYNFMKTNQLRPDNLMFLTDSGPTEFAERFAQERGITLQEFFKKHGFEELKRQWQANAKNKDTNANFQLLGKMITDQTVSDLDLYRFMTSQKIRSNGGWFGGNEGNHAALLLQHRGLTPEAFFKSYFFAECNAQWKKNAKEKNENGNNDILASIISDKDLTDDEVLKFFGDIGLRADGGWLIDKNSNKPTALNKFLQQNRLNVHKQLYPEAVPSNSASSEVAASIEVKKQEIVHPIKHLVTINCHGSFAEDSFALPPDVYVLVPHPDGFETPYVLLSPPSGTTFEEMIYNRQDGNFPETTSKGWYVFKPGETVRNLRLSPWSCSKDVQTEYNSWKASAPEEDVKALDVSKGIPQFAKVPAIDGKKNKLSYQGEAKSKIKVFGGTDLRRVAEELRKQQPDGPLVIAPFACNATNAKNQSVSCSLKKTTSINSLFS